MIPAAFEYHRPSTLPDAIALLGRLGDDAKVLAGGQSLLPILSMRLAAPASSTSTGSPGSGRSPSGTARS